MYFNKRDSVLNLIKLNHTFPLIEIMEQKLVAKLAENWLPNETKFEISVTISRDSHCSNFRDKNGFKIPVFDL